MGTSRAGHLYHRIRSAGIKMHPWFLPLGTARKPTGAGDSGEAVPGWTHHSVSSGPGCAIAQRCFLHQERSPSLSPVHTLFILFNPALTQQQPLRQRHVSSHLCSPLQCWFEARWCFSSTKSRGSLSTVPFLGWFDSPHISGIKSLRAKPLLSILRRKLVAPTCSSFPVA